MESKPHNYVDSKFNFTVPAKMCIIDLLLSIRENLDQEDNSILLAPEVPWYKLFYMSDKEMIHYNVTFFINTITGI